MNYAPRFTACCPYCCREVDQGTFRRHALREFLEDGTLRFYCGGCNVEWLPSYHELTNLECLLSEPVRSTAMTPHKVPRASSR